MMKFSAAVLVMCVAVCACGEFSGITNKKSIEEKNLETDTVLGKVLDELRFLRDENQKNKEENKKNKDEIHSLKDEDQKNKEENEKNKEENKKNKEEIHSLKEQYMGEINTLKDEDQKNKEENKKNKEENKKNKEEIHSLKEQYMAEIHTMKDEDKKNKEKIHSLKDEDQKNKAENRKNKGEINHLKELNEKNMNEITIQKELNKNNMKEINTLKGQTTNSQAAVASSAFMARMYVGNFYPDIGDVIPFNNVLLNVGLNYNRLTSVFTCAESGLYLFSVTLYSGSIGSNTGYYQMSGALMLGGEKVAELFSQSWDPDHYQHHQAAVTAVVECPKGGSVWVECQYNGGQIWGSDTMPGSVFTGFAINYNIHPQTN